MDVKTVSAWLGLAVVAGGVIYAAENHYALAATVTQQFNAQAIVQQESFNENRLERLQAELDMLRARNQAGYVYAGDRELEQYLLTEIQRARDYEEELRKLEAGVK